LLKRLCKICKIKPPYLNFQWLIGPSSIYVAKQQRTKWNHQNNIFLWWFQINVRENRERIIQRHSQHLAQGTEWRQTKHGKQKSWVTCTSQEKENGMSVNPCARERQAVPVSSKNLPGFKVTTLTLHWPYYCTIAHELFCKYIICMCWLFHITWNYTIQRSGYDKGRFWPNLRNCLYSSNIYLKPPINQSAN
jgi:hypothetical protein